MNLTRRDWLRIVACAAFAAILTACAIAWVDNHSKTWDIIGTVIIVTPTLDVPDQLPDDWPIVVGDLAPPYRTQACRGHGPAGDVRDGTVVTIYDESDTEVASASLPDGAAGGGTEVNGLGRDAIMCRFEFEMNDIPVADASHNRVQLGERAMLNLPGPTITSDGFGHLLTDLWVDGAQVSFDSPGAG